MTRARLLARAAVLLAAVVGASRCTDNTVTGPKATPTPVPPTPTPGPPHVVYVGQSDAGARANVFLDAESGTATTTIPAGAIVQWIWRSGTHSTTSGACPNGCVPDGIWDSGIANATTFQHAFPTAGTFPYFCLVHGTMMQGTVIVQ